MRRFVDFITGQGKGHTGAWHRWFLLWSAEATTLLANNSNKKKNFYRVPVTTAAARSTTDIQRLTGIHTVFASAVVFIPSSSHNVASFSTGRRETSFQVNCTIRLPTARRTIYYVERHDLELLSVKCDIMVTYPDTRIQGSLFASDI